jgi:hypothetical protein
MVLRFRAFCGLGGPDRAKDSGVVTKTLPMLLCAGIITLLSPSVSEVQQVRAASRDAGAIKQFEAAIAEYVAMRRRLADTIPPLVPNSTSVELNNASDALAAAVQQSRQNAGVGDLFVPPVAAVFKRKIDEAMRTANLRQALATIDDEEPAIRAPKIHLRFPGGSQLATTPPSLLNLFPTLPKGLEYRIVGRNLVLRDVDAALILDYIPDLIPR